MNRRQMRDRCPESEFKCKAFLDDYEFVFDGYSNKWGGAVANVVKKTASTVEGVIFKLTNSDLNKLDKFERINVAYDREELIAHDEGGTSYAVYVYKRTGQKIGLPSKGYRNTIISGAKECGLSQRYIEQVLEK